MHSTVIHVLSSCLTRVVGGLADFGIFHDFITEVSMIDI